MKTAFLTLALLACACAHGVVLDGLAAKVNDAVITVDDVGTAIGDMKRRGALPAPGDDFKAVYSNAVEFLVERRLILQLAAEKKVTFPEWVVDGRIRDIVKEKFDGDMNKLNAMLTQIKTPLTEWRNMIRDDMIVTSMRQQFVEKYVTATPADMAREYKENKHLYRKEAKSSVSVILLNRADILPDLPSAAPFLREQQTQGRASYVSFITGPSRTADIERVSAIGVHGPLELHIVLIGGRP